MMRLARAIAADLPKQQCPAILLSALSAIQWQYRH
jgi:hypothetical protein